MKQKSINYAITIDVTSERPELWIFGYGSLIWNPGFAFTEKRYGYARGYARRFYQGNTQHRGDEKQPGRVVTLVPEPGAYACGVLYKAVGLAEINAALQHLQEREVLNGYDFAVVPISRNTWCPGPASVVAITSIATDANKYYLGAESTDRIANDILLARGVAGPNRDYLLNLASSVRELFPDFEDEHLFTLEEKVLLLARIGPDHGAAGGSSSNSFADDRSSDSDDTSSSSNSNTSTAAITQ